MSYALYAFLDTDGDDFGPIAGEPFAVVYERPTEVTVAIARQMLQSFVNKPLNDDGRIAVNRIQATDDLGELKLIMENDVGVHVDTIACVPYSALTVVVLREVAAALHAASWDDSSSAACTAVWCDTLKRHTALPLLKW